MLLYRLVAWTVYGIIYDIIRSPFAKPFTSWLMCSGKEVARMSGNGPSGMLLGARKKMARGTSGTVCDRK